MNQELPDPQPGSPDYHRPNEPWACGHECEGHPCRLGPDKRGNCRAGPECIPVLEKKDGEEKGRWRCTRPGGACTEGPRPDGSCGKPILRCAPTPTLRWWRGRITAAVVVATIGILLVIFGGKWRGNYINQGTLSFAHSSSAFLARAGTNDVNQTCGACHTAGNSSLRKMAATALTAEPGLFDFHKLADPSSGRMTPLDTACQKCHAAHDTHQAHVKVALSCSSCHLEHRGPGRMAAPSDERCAYCHGDAEKLAAHSGKEMDHDSISRALARSFQSDHPSFRVHDERIRDTNTLKFNHALHLGSQTIPALPNGQKLDCAHCHQPDAAGAYIRKVRFENHCQSCHSLQFDPEAPELTLPHGDPELVSAFLRSLPKQYADLAARSGIVGRDEQSKFAQQKLTRLQQRFSSGDELEKRLFYSGASIAPARRIGSVSGSTPASYAGCAYCHEVKTSSRGRPEVTVPTMPERWLQHGSFDHSRHASMQCADCHSAATSKDTADVILPNRQSCAVCHSSEGGVVNSCVTCHSFHSKGHSSPVARLPAK